ncbi:NAD-dependent epimerase/dehydratase family protein [Croceicoccus sp. F390]|uniref:NAD-dependent epimerase/dehydratase family protein n=1 Tax=Croceicoccus esteveae TaxID=3075597 RepID=A0ABU2ZGX0_9SPHN|nr:NAD-dependent epimerase/dehydratase family protein [Croceicoccus sp. F390]MDT0575844.1 NAD-dependent epimerase/dehydratase family protein [Croceicoccus sp. F390]
MSSAAPCTVLVTGGAGFIGSNLADRLAAEGHRVRIYDALTRPGVEDNLEWLVSRHGDRIEPAIGDIRDDTRLRQAILGVDAVFHFAAQVAVTTSLDDPRADFDINIAATFNLLEAIRRQNPATPVIFASTNKVYGDLADLGTHTTELGHEPAAPALARSGVSERQPLDFHTPYGCSKGAADQYVLDYARSYAMRTAVLRMSCIYGQRQMGTEDQGWVAHFLIRALQDQPITLFGDGRQVRDICDVADTCDAYLSIWRNIDKAAGRAFNWGGGPANAVSLLALIEEIGRITDRTPQIRFEDWRAGDQRWFVADTWTIDTTLALQPRTPWRDGVRGLAGWLAQSRGLPLKATDLSKQAAGLHHESMQVHGLSA